MDEYNKNIETVKAALNDEEILCQLAEEACELGQAALKLRRTINQINPTPKTNREALKNLIEELADITVCLDALDIEASTLLKTIKQYKAARWAKRLTERTNGND